MALHRRTALLETIFIEPMRELIEDGTRGLTAFFVFEPDGLTQHSHEFHLKDAAKFRQLVVEFSTWMLELYRDLQVMGYVHEGEDYAFLVYMPNLSDAQQLVDEATLALAKLGYRPHSAFALGETEWLEREIGADAWLPDEDERPEGL